MSLLLSIAWSQSQSQSQSPRRAVDQVFVAFCPTTLCSAMISISRGERAVAAYCLLMAQC
jgi:hypothetical protein